VSTDIGPGYLADPVRSAGLGDGLLAMVGVNLDGDEWPWVMVAGAEDSRCSDDVPEHERTGRLPAEFRRRLGLSARRSPMGHAVHADRGRSRRAVRPARRYASRVT
jgi:hypothetical protein